MWNMGDCALAHILPSADGCPDAVKTRLDAAQSNVRHASNFNIVLKFCVVYGAMNYVAKYKELPNHGRRTPSGERIDMCKNGKPTLPPFRKWGEWRTKHIYHDEIDLDVEFLRADDATWIGNPNVTATEISNELRIDWQRGENIDKDVTGHGGNRYWAYKAENTKNDQKRRMAAFASAGFRGQMATFGRAVRNRIDDDP